MGNYPFSTQIRHKLNSKNDPISMDQDYSFMDAKLSIFEHIYDHLSLVIRSLDVQKNEVIMTSGGVEDLTGYPSEYFNKKDSWESIIHPDDYVNYLTEYSKLFANGRSLNLQYRIIHKNDEVVWVQDKTLTVLEAQGNLNRIDIIVTIISDQKVYVICINHLFYHDHFTNLSNRTCFDQKIESLIELEEGTKVAFSIMLMNLDRFKNINKTLDHDIGDKLLQQFGERVSKLLNRNSLFSRIGGDVFGIILWDYESNNYPETMAKTIIDSLKKPFIIEGFELYITASIGISTYPSNGTSDLEIIKNANLALHRAKACGKNHYQIYCASLDIASFKQYELERDLRKSITN